MELAEIRRKVGTIQFARTVYHRLARCAVQSGAIDLRRALTGRRDIIITFHRIRPAGQPADPFDTCPSMSVDVFGCVLEHVRKRFTVVPLRRLWEETARREAAAAITFDDGWRDTYDLAFPLLREFETPATVFVTTGMIGSHRLFWQQALGRMCRAADSSPERQSARRLCAVLRLPTHKRLTPEVYRAAVVRWKTISQAECERLLGQAGWTGPSEGAGPRRFLNAEEIRDMAGAGVEFGSHTVSHPILPLLSAAEIAWELAESKRHLESLLGNTVDMLAYPDGQYSGDIVRCARAAGYRIGCTTERRRLSRHDNGLRLPRVELCCERGESLEEFRQFGFRWQTR